MKLRLSHLNFCGVLALAVLCAFQWRHDRQLNLDLEHSGQVCLQQTQKLAEQARMVKGLNEDLAQLKISLVKERAERDGLELKLQGADATNQQLTAECAQLKIAVTNWVNAVAVRDAHLREANGRIKQLAADLNASVRKFNGLVTNYNAVVHDLNAIRARPASSGASQ